LPEPISMKASSTSADRQDMPSSGSLVDQHVVGLADLAGGRPWPAARFVAPDPEQVLRARQKLKSP